MADNPDVPIIIQNIINTMQEYLDDKGGRGGGGTERNILSVRY